MKVFVCEFVTAGGMRADPLPETLLPEGRLMRDAISADVEALPFVSALLSAHDDRLPAPFADSVPVGAGDDPWAIWANIAAKADVVWPIAPETAGLLARMVELFGASGARLVASDLAAIIATSRKANIAVRLAEAGLPHIPTFRLDDAPTTLEGPLLTKPDDGAGCENTRIWPDRAHLPATLAGQNLIVQPYVVGTAASLSVLVRPDTVRLLTVNLQNVRESDGVLSLKGLTVGALPDPDGQLARLAEAVVALFPGLAGIIGIDILLTPDGPVVVEVNPRVTTSYAGLGPALALNPAAFLPPFIREGRLPALPHFPPASPVPVGVR